MKTFFLFCGFDIYRFVVEDIKLGGNRSEDFFMSQKRNIKNDKINKKSKMLWTLYGIIQCDATTGDDRENFSWWCFIKENICWCYEKYVACMRRRLTSASIVKYHKVLFHRLFEKRKDERKIVLHSVFILDYKTPDSNMKSDTLLAFKHT